MWNVLLSIFKGAHRPARSTHRLRMESLSPRLPMDASGLGVQGAEGEWTEAPDFQLADVNPNSASLGARVSPMDFHGKLTAWYFIHST